MEQRVSASTVHMKTEPRTVRPFIGIEAADEAMEKVRFVVDREEHEALEGRPGNLVLADGDLASATISLHLPEIDAVREAVDKTGVPVSDCAFFVLARGRTHRASAALYAGYLHKATIPTELDVDRDTFPLILRDRSGFNMTVAVVLMHNNTPKPLRPSMPGTWLCRRDFRITPERDESSFSPEPLTDALRTEYGIPGGTTSFVKIEDNLETAEPISDAVRVFLDERVLNTLHASPNEPLAKYIQTDLAVTTMVTVAQSAYQRIAKPGGAVTEAELDAYPGVRLFFANLAAALGKSIDEVLTICTQPDLLRAHLAHAFGSLKATNAALKGADA